jgi:light-regulated signal transduction histidine kinase (bacteriophytochrome)
VVVCQDISVGQQRDTQIKDLVQELRQRARDLEAVNKELEAFSWSVSHNLRAPLRSIEGFSRALMEDHAERLNEEARDYLQRVCSGALRMGQLIDDLLRLSRVTRSEIRLTTVDLSALAHSVLAELARSQPERQVEYVVEPGLVVNADAQLLRIVMENLLGNAWKFTSKQARAKIEVGRAPWQGQLMYFVRDNGAGFDMAYADKLFGAFQRLHPAYEFEGTGVGLATVQRILHRHGGRISAEGAVGQGATFYFTLP